MRCRMGLGASPTHVSCQVAPRKKRGKGSTFPTAFSRAVKRLTGAGAEAYGSRLGNSFALGGCYLGPASSNTSHAGVWLFSVSGWFQR